MLIRVQQASAGVEDYLETGRKKGRIYSRDELDHREFISGDLDALKATNAYVQDNENWKNNYWHLTLGLTLDDWDKLRDSPEKLQELHRDILEHYYCTSDVDKLIHHSEMHIPKLQSYDAALLKNSTETEMIDRFPHAHIIVSKYDINSPGTQIRMLPFDTRYQSADKAFQSMLCEKYGLTDPKDHARSFDFSKKDVINRTSEKQYHTHKKGTVVWNRKELSELLKGVTTFGDIKQRLLDSDLVKDATFNKKTSPYRYLSVIPTHGDKNINLRGKGFEDVTKIIRRLKKTPQFEKLTNEEIVNRHKNWFISEETQKNRGLNKKITQKTELRYEKAAEKYVSYYEKYTKEQRQYYMVYKDEIKSELINNYKIYEKNNVKHLINNKEGVKIFDKPDVVSISFSKDKNNIENSVKLSLELAIKKGWDISTLKITTKNSDIKKEYERQILAYKELNSNKEIIPNINHSPIPIKIQKVNSTTQLVKSITANTTNLKNPDINQIKAILPPQAVLNYAAKHYGLQKKHYEIVDNGIRDVRTKQKPRSVVDFMTKSVNIPFSEAINELAHLTNRHIENELMKPRAAAVPKANPTPPTKNSIGSEFLTEMVNEQQKLPVEPIKEPLAIPLSYEEGLIKVINDAIASGAKQGLQLSLAISRSFNTSPINVQIELSKEQVTIDGRTTKFADINATSRSFASAMKGNQSSICIDNSLDYN